MNLADVLAASIRNDLHAPIPVPPEVMAANAERAVAAAGLAVIPANTERVLRIDAHIHNGFARSAELGSLEADEPKTPDFYRGKAEGLAKAADRLAAAGLAVVPVAPAAAEAQSMSAAEKLAKLIRRRYDITYEVTGRVDRYPTEESLADYILEHAAEAGLAVIQLPKPDYDDHWDVPSCGEFNGMESTGDSVISVELTDEGIEVEVFDVQTPMESRLLAAALLAAADAAEAAQ